MQTRLPSLELGLERGAKAGNCDSGYSCAYTSNLSWRSPESPVAKEVDPAAVFDRLFGDALADTSLQQRSRRDRYKTSLLDLVREDAQDLQGKLGNSDRQKLEEYLYAVRDIERRLENASRLRNADAGLPDYPRPAGVPPEYEQHARLMFDLMALAIQTDATRVLTFMFTNEGSNRSYPQIGVSDGHHDLSHHGNDREKQAKISKINHHHVSMFAYLIEKLANTPEGDGTLLDNCMVLYGSGIGDGNAHNHDHLPLVLLGRGGGTLASGRHLSYADETPLTNLYLSMLQRSRCSGPLARRQHGPATGSGRDGNLVRTRDPLSLLDRHIAIAGQVTKDLLASVCPAHFHPVHVCAMAESKVQAGILVGQIAIAPLIDTHLTQVTGRDRDLGAQGGRGGLAGQCHADPVISIAAVVAEQGGRPAQVDVRNDDVQIAVVVVVPHGRAAPDRFSRK